MTSRIKRLAWGWLALLLVGASLPLRAQIFFGITPIRVEHEIAEGKNLTDAFHVRNNAEAPIRIRVYAENWRLKRDGTPLFVGGEPVAFSCRDWIRVNPQDFRLNPGEIKLVRYTLSVPDGIEPGGFHASVSFENVPLSGSEGGGSRMVLTGKIAAAVYIKVGRVQPRADIIDLQVEQSGERPTFKLIVKNTGRTHFRTKGRIEIKDEAGRSLGADIPLPDKVVLPESEVDIVWEALERLPPGPLSVLCVLDIGRDELLGFEKKVIISHER